MQDKEGTYMEETKKEFFEKTGNIQEIIGKEFWQ